MNEFQLWRWPPRRGGLRFVRPLLGATAALALIIGVAMAFSYTVTEPSSDPLRVEMPVHIVPLPPT
ncbi:hypothetical protein HLB23_03815 [Nocardia uniformis]|uniref:Uncharacterized protein n=1 Tax=Nocardia uniformis TaxID=53432 RepID=A0A849BVN3_9NOCA|nr:hypothetical protein [Nocardia uniformis]NNH69006.1 hypothetical protein [Nocardia uniformis]